MQSDCVKFEIELNPRSYREDEYPCSLTGIIDKKFQNKLDTANGDSGFRSPVMNRAIKAVVSVAVILKKKIWRDFWFLSQNLLIFPLGYSTLSSSVLNSQNNSIKLDDFYRQKYKPRGLKIGFKEL